MSYISYRYFEVDIDTVGLKSAKREKFSLFYNKSFQVVSKIATVMTFKKVFIHNFQNRLAMKNSHHVMETSVHLIIRLSISRTITVRG